MMMFTCSVWLKTILCSLVKTLMKTIAVRELIQKLNESIIRLFFTKYDAVYSYIFCIHNTINLRFAKNKFMELLSLTILLHFRFFCPKVSIWNSMVFLHAFSFIYTFNCDAFCSCSCSLEPNVGNLCWNSISIIVSAL